MRIIICGAGEIGSHASEVLDGNGHSITVIDLDPEKLSLIEERLDASTLQGNAAQADVLVEAGTADADLFFGATSDDEVNLLAASLARRLGPARPSPGSTTTPTSSSPRWTTGSRWGSTG